MARADSVQAILRAFKRGLLSHAYDYHTSLSTEGLWGHIALPYGRWGYC